MIPGVQGQAARIEPGEVLADGRPPRLDGRQQGGALSGTAAPEERRGARLTRTHRSRAVQRQHAAGADGVVYEGDFHFFVESLFRSSAK